MWSDDEGPFEGKHYRLAETICQPPPVQQPRPRILIGGGGEKKTLRLVARYADACNLFALDVDEVSRKIDVLHRHCETEDRDPSEIKITILGVGADPAGDPDGFLTAMEPYARLGVELVEIVPPMGTDPVDYVARACEVIPRLTELG
jgi:hypothetical protein